MAKEQEEGLGDPEINWGALCDTEQGVRPLPEAKLQKADVPADRVGFYTGNEHVPRKLAQQVRGSPQY